MMRKRDVEAAIGEAYRVDRAPFESPGLEEAKRELLSRIVAEPQEVAPAPVATAGPIAERHGIGQWRGRYLALGGAVAAMAAILLLAIGIGAGPAGSPAPALAKNLRLTAVSPHVLLDAPGWRVEGASEVAGSRGTIRFSHGDGELVPYLGGRLSIAFEAAAELRWRSNLPPVRVHPPDTVRATSSDFAFVTRASALGATVRVFARAVPPFRVRQYAAAWVQDGRYLTFRTFAPSLGAFVRRLSSLRRVSRDRWLHALPTHRVRGKDPGVIEAPGRRTFIPRCDPPLPPALAAREGNPKVRQLRRWCGLIEGSPFAE
jgi:hypothetical protein